MTDDSDRRRDLLARIEHRQGDVRAWLRVHRHRVQRRATLTVVLTSLSAAFTAGPALGGTDFSTYVAETLDLEETSSVWQVLCILALAVSVGAAVLVNLEKRHDSGAKVGAAESVDAELDGLTTLLEVGNLPVDEAAKLYQQCTTKVPFVAESAGRRPRAAAR